MKNKYACKDIRNVVVLGHMKSGKTSLLESLALVSKTIDKKGEVERKNTISDYLVEEQNKMTTLNTAILPLEWENCKINILDTPGSEEFIGEVENVLSIIDGAILLVDATKGVEVGTERAWNVLVKNKVPTLIIVNKADKENVKFDEVITSIKEKLSSKAQTLVLPIGISDSFEGVIDLVEKKAYHVKNGLINVPSNKMSEVDKLYSELMEVAAGTSEELIEKFLNTMELTSEEFKLGLSNGVFSGEIYPILVSNAINNIGIKTLLDYISHYLPSPDKVMVKGKKNENLIVEKVVSEQGSASGIVFKTTIDNFVGTISYFKVVTGTVVVGNEVYLPELDKIIKIPQLFFLRGNKQIATESVSAGDIGCVAKVGELTSQTTFCDKKDPIIYSKVVYPSPIIYIAIKPKKKDDEDKISSSLQRLKIEDGTLEIVRNPETSQLLLGGQGLTHLGYVLERMSNMFKVDIETVDQKIVYRETIKAEADAEGKHKKQSGGAGQFGHVFITFKPLKNGSNFEFTTDRVVGGAVPKNYFPAVEKGLIETLEHGPLAGFPVINIRAELYYGSYHDVDSNEISFKLAARLAFVNAVFDQKGEIRKDGVKPTILEPIMEVEVFVKNEYVGDVMGDMTKRRGRVIGMGQQGAYQIIKAEVPEVEIIKYAIDLKAMSQASGRFTRKFLRYEEVPIELQKKIIEEYSKKEEGK